MTTKGRKGSITQLEPNKPKGKCRKWKLVIPLGKDPLTGKYPQKCKRFTGTYTEAVIALEEFRASFTKGELVRKDSWTFEEFIPIFLDMRKNCGRIAKGTFKRDVDNLQSLSFLLGKIRLQEIDSVVLNRAYRDLMSGKSRSGKNLSGTYVHDIHCKASLLFDYAVVLKKIGKNPCADATPPKIDTAEKRALDIVKVRELLEVLDPTNFEELAVLLVVVQGVRRGETVGLSSGDLSFKYRTLAILRTEDDDGDLNKTKTSSSKRLLPMSRLAYKALRARKLYQMRTYAKKAPHLCVFNRFGHVRGLKPETPIIASDFGERIKPHSVTTWWRRHRAGYDLEGWTLHELRHTFLSIAAMNNVHPSVMQDLAGHATSRTSLDIYTHVNMDAKRDAMETIDKAL